MEPIDNQHREKVIADIGSIKAVLNKNRMILQQIMVPFHLVLVGAIGCVAIILFCLIIHLLIGHYGEFGLIPRQIRYTLYGLMAAVGVLMSAVKLRGFSVTGRQIDPAYTLRRVLKEMFSFKIVHLYLPIISLIIFFAIYFAYRQIPAFILPTILIGLGLLSNFIGMLIEIRLYLFLGYYLLCATLVIIVFPAIPMTFAVAGSLGVGYLLFTVMAYRHVRADRPQRSDRSGSPATSGRTKQDRQEG